jgi:hypothetical protein
MSLLPLFCTALFALPVAIFAQETPAAAKPAAASRVIGEVTAVNADEITVKTDAGAPATFKLSASTSYLRVSPGEKDLSKASRITITDITVGDRVLARIRNAAEGQPANPASSVYLMSKAEIAKHQETGRAEWQKRGVAGKVSAVDAAAQTFAIQTQTPTGLKDVTVQASAKTGFRRYASDSIRFSDAKPGTATDIKVGDNLRVLGDRNAEGTSIQAEEIVSGTFRNIAGTILAIDAAKGEIRINNLENKKPITVKISADTSLKKLPAMMANFMARSRQGGAAGTGPGGTGGPRSAGPGAGGPAADAVGPGSAANTSSDNRVRNPAAGNNPGVNPAPGATPGGGQGAGAGGGRGMGGGFGGPGGPGGGRGDFQQMMERVPAITLTDLKVGDAVIISSSTGSDPSTVLAISLVAGVEPLFTASPSGQSVLNGSWNFGEVGLPQ